MNAAVLFLGFVIGIVAGYLLVSRRAKPKRIWTAEYWVFLPGEELPDQNAIMTRTIGGNPYHRSSGGPISTAEGLVFSDIRLHIALLLRRKNPSAFRPDLFASADATPEVVQAIDAAKSFVKVRFVSEEALPDLRHLQFLPHAADAIAELGGGAVIYDATAERLITREELGEFLGSHTVVSGPELHSRILWKNDVDGGHAETRGMAKVGKPDLRTRLSHTDQRVLVREVMEEAVKALWNPAELPEELEVSAFDDQFRVLLTPQKDSFAEVRIMRLQTL